MLALPAQHVELKEEEMMYVDGGAYFTANECKGIAMRTSGAIRIEFVPLHPLRASPSQSCPFVGGLFRKFRENMYAYNFSGN